MSEMTDLLADCPDSVQVTLGAVSVAALWKTTVEINDGGGNLATLLPEEHLVIATDSLPGLAKKAAISITENAGYGGGIHARTVKFYRLANNDRALTLIFLDKP